MRVRERQGKAFCFCCRECTISSVSSALYDAFSFLGSWRWPLAPGEVTEAEIETITDSRGHVQQRLAVAYKFSIGADGPYTGESFWSPAFFSNRSLASARRSIRHGKRVLIRYRTDDPSVNRLDASVWRSLGTKKTEPGHQQNLRVDPQPSKQERQRHWMRVSREDILAFVLIFVLAFLVFRFDIHRHGRWFRDPMRTKPSAEIALVVATAFTAYYKVKGTWFGG